MGRPTIEIRIPTPVSEVFGSSTDKPKWLLTITREIPVFGGLDPLKHISDLDPVIDAMERLTDLRPFRFYDPPIKLTPPEQVGVVEKIKKAA